MTKAHREPSRLPVRGTIATVGTVGALALLFSFRGGPLAPSESVLAAVEPRVSQTPEPSATGTSGAEATVGPVSITGDTYTTPYGDVQVEVTLDGGDITEVVALTLPAGDRQSRRISQYVEPILREEAVSGDSADVAVISGATFTSKAYAASLQSALDGATTAEVAATANGDTAAPTTDPAKAGDPSDGSGTTPTDATPAAAPVTVTGQAVRFRFGTVQVAATVEGNDIVDVQALRLPDGDRHSAQISDYVEPILRDEAISADNAQVSVISGATYTSRAYATSLQSALDQLG